MPIQLSSNDLLAAIGRKTLENEYLLGEIERLNKEIEALKKKDTEVKKDAKDS